MGHTDGPVVSDFNQDGVPDLGVGTETGQIYYWQRSSFDITSTMTTEGKQGPANYLYFPVLCDGTPKLNFHDC